MHATRRRQRELQCGYPGAPRHQSRCRSHVTHMRLPARARRHAALHQRRRASTERLAAACALSCRSNPAPRQGRDFRVIASTAEPCSCAPFRRSPDAVRAGLRHRHGRSSTPPAEQRAPHLFGGTRREHSTARASHDGMGDPLARARIAVVLPRRKLAPVAACELARRLDVGSRPSTGHHHIPVERDMS